jgi:MoxR-like ATPase
LEILVDFENQYSITLPRPKYESDENLKVNFENSFTFKNKSLVFETGILEALESQISNALRNHKNIILVGPPGRGKSKLAKEICNHYRKSEYNLITANSDWSTFDTIGGYKPQKDGSLKFQPGLFLKQFKNNEMNINRWLIIDEINRADIDKAFGAFFSALAGDQVNLSFEDENGENIVITNNEGDYKNHHYLIHNDWRLIATMNTLDKTSLYEMSYAFMRRFAFISVPSPRNISNELIHRYLTVWKIENKDYVEDIKKVWQLINNYRKIGPALIEDFYKYLVASQGDYASAINMFVIPQLEGVYDDKIIELRDKLSEFDFIKEKDMLKDFINNFFMLEE